GGVDADLEPAAHLAVDLHDDRDLRLLQRRRIGDGPALLEEALTMAELLPQLLGHVRAEGPQQEQGRLHRFANERDAVSGRSDAVSGGGLEGLERVDELHDRGDRRVEMELALDVVGHSLDRLVDRPPERAPLLRRRNGDYPRAIRRGTRLRRHNGGWRRAIRAPSGREAAGGGAVGGWGGGRARGGGGGPRGGGAAPPAGGRGAPGGGPPPPPRARKNARSRTATRG